MHKLILVMILAVVSSSAMAEELAEKDNGANRASNENLMRLYIEAKDVCTKEFANSKLDPLRGKIPFWAESPTNEMRKNRNKPSAIEREALRVYINASVACERSEIKLFASDEKSPHTQDRQSKNEWEPEIKQLINGKITYAEYARHIDQRHKEWGKKLVNPVDTAALDTWYKNALDMCATNRVEIQDECKTIAKKSYDDSTACNGGDTKACSDRDNDQININRWNAGLSAANAAPKLVTLNCSLNGQSNGQQDERALTIDYANNQVNGMKAEFYENVISWSYPSSDGSTQFHVTLNRLSGFYNSGSDQFPSLWTGHCAPATKQF